MRFLGLLNELIALSHPHLSRNFSTP